MVLPATVANEYRQSYNSMGTSKGGDGGTYNYSPQIVVNAQTGANPREIAKAVTDALADSARRGEFRRQMRDVARSV